MLKKLFMLFVITCSLCAKATDMETVKVILPYGLGGGPDRVFRILQDYGLKKNINFVPEYKPGAQGFIGMQHALTYENTLMLCIVSDLIILHNKNKLDIHRYRPIGGISKAEVQLAVRADLPVESMRDLISQLKTNPQKYTWAVSSSSMEAQVQWIARQMNLQSHDLFVVNFQTIPQGINAVAAGNVDIVASPTAALVPMYQMKKIKSLGLIKGMITTPGDETIEDIFKATIPPDGFGMFMANTTDAKQSTRWSKFIQEFIADPVVVEKFNKEYFPVFEDSQKGLDKILRFHISNNGKVNSPQALTFRQEQIARLIKHQGMSNKQLSETLKISEATVKLHTGIIMKKFGVQNRTQLVVAMNNFG